MPALDQQILEYIARPGYEPQKLKPLAKNLGVTKKKMAGFQDAIERLQDAGQLRVSKNGRVQKSAAKGTVIGILRRIASGAGFLIPHEPRPPGLEGDVFVEQRDLQDAQNGDEVVVRLTSRRRSGGGRCGKVIDVLERATNVFVGTYFEEDDAGWVEIDGKDFTEPIWVGDPGAKGARPEDKVVIEMLRFPAHRQAGEGVLTKVLGARGEPGVDTQLVIHEYGLPHEYPEEALEEARIEAENFDPDNPDLTGREDLTGETIVTIDPVDARDFDDAISLTRDENGHWHLGVHIADVAAFVKPGTALDDEAKLRGTSVYLPTLVIPMLPEVISNGLASLQEKRLRLTKSVFIEFTADGAPVSTRFANTAIRVTKRFAYEQVMPIVQAPQKKHGRVSAKIRRLLADMHELAMLLRGRRIKKGYLELDMPEIKLEFDADQRVTGAHEAEHDESHEIIEEFMLAANIAVANEFADRAVTFIRRTHGQPSPVKLKQLQELMNSLGFKLKNPENRGELQKLLKEARGTTVDRAINFAILRSMKRAEYSALEGGHYALAEENYCHFTSPIRRYPDLTIHRLFDFLLLGNPTSAGASGDALLQLAHHCSTTERRAADAERELTHLKLLNYLEGRIGLEMEATITGVDRYGFFARGTKLPAEGLVHISTLSESDYFDFDRGSMTLTGRRKGTVYRLGDRVVVAVVNVDVDRRELDLRLVKKLASGTRADRSTGRSNRRKRTSKKAPQRNTSTKGKRSSKPKTPKTKETSTPRKRGGGRKRRS